MITSDFTTEEPKDEWEEVHAIAGPLLTMRAADRPDEQTEKEEVEWQPRVRAVNPTSSSMSGGQLSIGGPVNSGFAIAVVSLHDLANAGVIAWRLWDSRIEIPDSHLERVFRPPRS